MQWLAGWNMPGCLPETKPAAFTHWDDAATHIAYELNTWIDQECYDSAENVPSETLMQLNKILRDLDSGSYDDDTWQSHITAGGYVFWIERS